MRDIRIAAAQFENRDGDKEHNLAAMRRLAERAVSEGAEVVSFHEGSVCGYTFMRNLGRAEIVDLAEPVPGGASTRALIEMAGSLGAALLAGLIEREGDELYNTYVCVDGDGLVASHRKLHAFLSPHLSSGDEYTVFDLDGVTCGILTCFDSNLIENVRITTLMGAEVVYMPHVTCCLPSAMPGRGLVDPKLWENRERDPVRLKQEFMGPKGRGWLMRWLPTRAYENGIYVVFSNPVGMDDDQVRNGNAMIIDPHGEIIAESNALGEDVVVGLCVHEKIEESSGRRYIRARRPELYAKLVEKRDEPAITDSGWGPSTEGVR
jgi:predicted amidohydrolase